MEVGQRDHLFISYAWEDAALAEWLARKLMCVGYAVWIDRFKLLGGDTWPDDIDHAIKERSFRMVHLLSRSSLAKENPSKERQLALTLSKQRKEKFLIPLNVDGISPADIPWQLTDIQYVAFSNWAAGLAELLKTLESSGCPKPYADKGASLAIQSHMPLKVVRDEPERLISNCYAVTRIPEAILRFDCRSGFTRDAAARIGMTKWPCFHISDSRVLSFESPPDEVARQFGFTQKGGSCWKSLDTMEGVRVSTIVKRLTMLAFACIAHRRGLADADGQYWYFTRTDDGGDGWYSFPSYAGPSSRIKLWGKRTVQDEPVLHTLGFAIRLRDDIQDGLCFLVKVRLHLTDALGNVLPREKIPSRRKAVAANWWNHKWLLRQQAIIHHLSEGMDEFCWGGQRSAQVAFSAVPLGCEVRPSLDDAYIDSIGSGGRSEEGVSEEQLDAYYEAMDDDNERDDGTE